jgi:hypothetical protein
MRSSCLMGLLLLPCLMQAQEVRAALTLWAADCMTRVMRDSPAGDPQPPELHAAGNEWEAFQLVVSGTAEELRSMLVSCGSLRCEEIGGVIPAPVILREHYVEVRQPSELSAGRAGWYPDALVPQGVPFDDPPVPAEGRVNQPYWIDVHVPKGTAPGLYRGEVKAASVGGTELRMPFTVQVWGFDLPRVPSLKTSFFITWRRVAEVHGFDRNANDVEPRLGKVLDAYYDMLVEHRLSPHEVWEAYPDPQEPLSEESYERIEVGLRHHLLERGTGTVSLPLWVDWPFADPLGKDRDEALRYAARYAKICERLGCGDRLYKIFGELDEPRDSAGYEKVREWGQFFGELVLKHGVKVPLLITEKPGPEDPAWGKLDEAVDIWVPHVANVWEDLESARPPREIPRQQAAGKEVWCYTALVQAPDEWKVARGRPSQISHSHPPVWLLDYAPMNHRILAWLMPRHGITGLTYWDVSYWRKEGHNPWKDAGSYPHDNGDVYQGDGFFIYPARKETQGREGPCASLRLKWLRESAEDYDYIALLMKRGFKETALEPGLSFARGFGDWDDNPVALMAARKSLGELLHKLHRRDG